MKNMKKHQKYPKKIYNMLVQNCALNYLKGDLMEEIETMENMVGWD